jgi:hypothetical protein
LCNPKEFAPVKAVRYYGRKDIRIDDVMEPDGYAPNQLLVKPLWTGICGTDLHEYIAGPIVTPATPHVFTAATLPQILGHEFSAEVLEVGKDVANLKRGDRVSIQPLIMPMNDYYSRRGLNHLSEKMGCVGLSWAWGGMSEYAVINDYASSWNRVGRFGLVLRLCLLRSHPFVRSAPSFRPDLHARYAGARSGGQGWPVFGPLARSVLDGCEHDGMIGRVGGPSRQRPL